MTTLSLYSNMVWFQTNRLNEILYNIRKSLYSNMVWFQTCVEAVSIDASGNVSIPIWSDFKHKKSDNEFARIVVVSIPIWSDFKQAINREINKSNTKGLYSNMVWFQTKNGQVECKSERVKSLFQYGLISN